MKGEWRQEERKLGKKDGSIKAKKNGNGNNHNNNEMLNVGIKCISVFMIMIVRCIY